MHIVTADNADELYDAYRDTAMMFADIAEQGGRLTDANVWVRFDPLKFVDARHDGKFNYGDLDLARTGAALAILCDFYDRWEEERPLEDEHTAPFIDAIRAGRLSSFDDIVSTILEASRRENAGTLNPWFNDAIRPIYRRYVQSWFAKRAAAEDWRLAQSSEDRESLG